MRQIVGVPAHPFHLFYLFSFPAITHSLTHSLTFSFLAHSLICSLTHLLAHELICSLTNSFAHSLLYTLIYSLAHSFSPSLICSLARSLNGLLTLCLRTRRLLANSLQSQCIHRCPRKYVAAHEPQVFTICAYKILSDENHCFKDCILNEHFA